MNFPRRARLKRISEILPRFPEAKELLLRYRAKLEAAEDKRGPEHPDPAPDRDRARLLYAQSLSCVGYLVDRFGMARVKELLLATRRTSSLAASFHARRSSAKRAGIAASA